MIRCSGCGYDQIPDGSLRCPQCAAPIAQPIPPAIAVGSPVIGEGGPRMFCRQCGSEIPSQAVVCVKCGVATGVPVAGAIPSSQQVPLNPPKSRLAYILFGLLLGFPLFLPGIHNLYAGYTSKGLIQLLLTIFTCGLLWLPMYIWTVVEVCTVTVDAKGVPFTS
jgi:TM2 domain-containing membrane protein YozV